MRHSPTTWNLNKRIQGNVETDIVEEAIEPYFEKINAEKIPRPDAIIVSALKRTTQTANALIQYRKWPMIPIHQDVRFNERQWGIFEGVPIAEAWERFQNDPQIRSAFPDAKDWDEKDFKVEGGESIEEVAERVKPALIDVSKKYEGMKILFVLHAGVLVSLGLDYHKIHFGMLTANGNLIKTAIL